MSGLPPKDASPAPEALGTDREPRRAPDVPQIHQQVMREMAEPRDGLAPTPVWLMMVFFGLLMWGGYYLASNSGGFRADVYSEKPAALYRGAAGDAAAKPVDLLAVGKRAYNNCTQCHQADGQGVAGAFPPLDGSARVAGPPHVLAALLLHGLQGPVVVRGQKYDGQMPAWSQLSDTEIAGVLTFIRQAWSNRQPAVTPELVAAMRSATSGQVGAYTSAALDELARQAPPALAEPAPPSTGTAPAEAKGR